MSKYVIQFTGQVSNPQPTNFVLGVSSPGINAPVVLSNLDGTLNTQWNLDVASGQIISAADPNLCLTFVGTSPSDGTRLVLQQRLPGSLNQRWNWVGNTPRITVSSFPTFAIDDYDCTHTPGTPLQLYNLSGQCQAWQVISAGDAQELAASA
ncbi:MAG TPA: ricin-type beta-trefoil lectin domain protein [Thermoanaerobaculia bacterium]